MHALLHLDAISVSDFGYLTYLGQILPLTQDFLDNSDKSNI